MPEKRVDSWTIWEQCERMQGADALSRLASEHREFFADSMLVSSRWSRLPFYAAHRLMELRFVRDHGAERAFVLHGPKRTWWLNGDSGPMHEVNDAESLALTESTVGDYVRFFLCFLRADEGAFVLIESADEIQLQPDAGELGEDQERVLDLEAARSHAVPLLMRGTDATGRWLIGVTLAYGSALFAASLVVEADGITEMLDDDPIMVLDGLEVPEAPSLTPGELTSSAEPEERASEPAAGMVPVAPSSYSGLPPDEAELFVGRTTEQDMFRQVLGLAAASGSDGPGAGQVVLVEGPAASGSQRCCVACARSPASRGVTGRWSLRSSTARRSATSTRRTMRGQMARRSGRC